MSEPDSTPPPEDLWQDFHKAEAASAEQLEEQYKVIEGYNSKMLNQVAGIEDAVFELQGRIGEDGIDPLEGQGEIRGKSSFMSLLYLKPDTREYLVQQGEVPQVADLNGNPYVIRGEVPARTQKLIDDLFASTGAVKDNERSKPTWEVWKGDVAGQPIEFDVYRHVHKLIRGDHEEEVPTLAIYVNKGGRDLPTQVGQTVKGTFASLGARVIDAQDEDRTDEAIDELGESSRNAAEKALRSIDRSQARSKFFQNMRNKIFPKRKKY